MKSRVSDGVKVRYGTEPSNPSRVAENSIRLGKATSQRAAPLCARSSAHLLRICLPLIYFPPFPPLPSLSISHLRPFFSTQSHPPVLLPIRANLPYIHPIKILLKDAQTGRVPKITALLQLYTLSHDHLHRACLYSFQLKPIRPSTPTLGIRIERDTHATKNMQSTPNAIAPNYDPLQ